jgi:sarcosine oxidase subunit delta
MMLIPCPWCGPRPEDEFTFGEDASAVPPADPASLSDQEWTDYLYFRDNPKGDHKEFWFHRASCHHWFILERNTVTHVIAASYPPGGPVTEVEQ